MIPSDFQLLQLKFIFISFSQTFASYSIFNYIWNILLLLLFSNIKINQGLRPIDQNPVFCTICSRKINRGPQQDVAPTCSNKNCSARYHKKPVMLYQRQTHHAKDSGRSVIWKCLQHGSGITKVIPSAPIYEQPN